MKVLFVLCTLAVAAFAQYEDAPIPYSYNYVADSEDGGSSSHQESGDGSGRVSGSYTVTNLEGHNRLVEYVADENGFRAIIKTNEPGTANLNPADVTMESTAEGAGGAPAVRSAPAPRPVAPAPRPAAVSGPAARQGGVRYVLVPITDPRAAAAGYYE